MHSITDLSRPAFLACISYLLLAFALVIPMGLNDRTNDKPKYNFSKRIMVVIIMLIPICLSVYSINCMVIGGCNIWAWTQSIVLAIWVALFILIAIIPRD